MMVKFERRFGKIPKDTLLPLLGMELDYVEGTLTQLVLIRKPGTKNDELRVPIDYVELVAGGNQAGENNS